MRPTPRLVVAVLASFLAGGIVPQAALVTHDHAVGCVAAPGKQNAHPAEPKQDIHFTSGNPFAVIAGLKIYF